MNLGTMVLILLLVAMLTKATAGGLFILGALLYLLFSPRKRTPSGSRTYR